MKDLVTLLGLLGMLAISLVITQLHLLDARTEIRELKIQLEPQQDKQE